MLLLLLLPLLLLLLLPLVLLLVLLLLLHGARWTESRQRSMFRKDCGWCVSGGFVSRFCACGMRALAVDVFDLSLLPPWQQVALLFLPPGLVGGMTGVRKPIVLCFSPATAALAVLFHSMRGGREGDGGYVG